MLPLCVGVCVWGRGGGEGVNMPICGALCCAQACEQRAWQAACTLHPLARNVALRVCFATDQPVFPLLPPALGGEAAGV